METQVDLEFETFSGFVTEYSSNVCERGMFVRCKDPKPAGTALSFEFKLSDDSKLIAGLGEVAWARKEDLSEERPAGMGIRFVELDQPSRDLIAKMVENHLKSGGKPFDLSPSLRDGLETDFRAFLESVEETAAPPSPETTAPKTEKDFFKKAEERKKKIDLEAVLEDKNVSLPISEAPGTLMQPKPRKPKPAVNRRKVFKIGAPAGIAIAAAVGIGSAVILKNQITRFVLKLVEGEPKKEMLQERRLPQLNPTVAPTPAPPSPSPLTSFSKIEKITWERTADGFVVALVADGLIPPENYSNVRVSVEPPRELIKIIGVKETFPAQTLTVNAPEVLSIRTGFHVGPPNELHVVIDLADPAVRVTQIEPEGAAFRIHLGK